MADRKKGICLLSGFSEETDRNQIKREFGKFGTITKIYLSDDFAKIYYDDQESCRNAVKGLSVNHFGWVVEQTDDKPYHKPAGKVDNSFGSYPQSKSGSSNFGASSKKPGKNMGDYGYLEEEFSENMDYCDIHGNPLVLFQADSGEKYVNVEDVRKAGFALFRRDSFNPLLVDRRQIQKEFELHLLSESKNYILKNKAVVIDEEQILKTIERCKNKLLGEQSFDRNQSLNQTPVDHTFAKPERPVQQRGGFNSFDTSSPIVPQRMPKALPSNFMPTATQRNSKPWAGDQQRQQRSWQSNRDTSTRETNGFGDDAFENKGSFSHKSRQSDGFGSNSSMTRSKSRHRDDTSQVSDTSDKKRRYADIDSVDKIDKVELDIGSAYDVTITHIEKDNICWAHKTESAAELENMLIKLFDLAPELEDLSNPVRGQLALAMFEDVWCRARIYNNNSPLYIHFLDYGNRHNTETVKVFPEELRKIPVLGLRFILNNIQTPLATEGSMRIRICRKYPDGTYVADFESMITAPTHEQKKEIREPAKPEKIVNEEKKFVEKEKPKPVEVKPREVEKPRPVEVRPNKVEKPAEVIKKEPSPPKTYFDVPKQLAKLENGDKVMLIDMVDNKFVVKTKESIQKGKELLEYIKNLDKSTLLLPSVEEGQLVLCSKDGFPNLYRAVVVKKTSAVAVNLRYLDYAGEDQLAIKSLRNVDDFLASQPTLLLLTPEYKLLESLETKSTEFVFQLMEQKEKVNVVITDDNQFDLQLDDGTLLSQKIKLLNKKEEDSKVPKLVPVISPAKEPQTVKPSPQKIEKPEPEAVPAVKSDPITYDDMDWIKLEVGSTDSYLCYTIKDLEDLTLISLKEDSINHMAKVTDLAVEDTVPYEPSEFEMCLVSYQAPEDDEPQWYRGVVIEVGENGRYTIQAVDFGNQVVVKSKDIRRFDEDLKDIPILGISCECVGIPNNAAVLDKLKQMIPEGEEVKVVIKEFNELKYQIEIPEVYKMLKQEGLC